jgi:hypothetical protein
MAKRHVYVDETGQDTKGKLFIVATVVLSEIDDTCTACEKIEALSGKAISKWGKTRPAIRLIYIREILKTTLLMGTLRFAVFSDSKDYDAMTVETIARALGKATIPKTKTRIYVDALSKAKRREYAQLLRQSGIQTDEVRGIERDESNALIRLADAIAGFVRDALETEDGEERKLYEKALKRGQLIHLK